MKAIEVQFALPWKSCVLVDYEAVEWCIYDDVWCLDMCCEEDGCGWNGALFGDFDSFWLS